MNWFNKKNKIMAFTLAGLFVVTGTYNAVVINSESHLSGSEVKFVKRLDEIYGVTIQGRQVAASMSWQKVAPQNVVVQQPVQVVQTVSQTASAPAPAPAVEQTTAAAVQEELTLSLTEVVNPKKYAKGLTNTQFNGTLSTNNGVIENLAVSLPNGEGVSVSFSEMTGNVFEYDLDGELYSGMMYQVDQYAYMVTLTNGPLEGTRLRFSAERPAEEQQQVQETLAENNNVDVGTFGVESAVPANDSMQVQAEEVNPEILNQNDLQMQQEAAQAQGFNLEQT